MKPNKLKIAAIFLATVLGGCTKLDETLQSRLTNQQTANALGSQGVALLLQAAYADLGGMFTGQDQIFSLQENSTDESLVPTRGGDWDDNGVWRVVHAHTWNADHGQVLSVFNNLNKLNFDATNVLAFSPSTSQAAQARFLRALALYYLLDLYNQYPFRNPGDNLLNAPQVKSGADAVAFIVSELTAVLPNLPTTGGSSVATQDAAKVLLMKTYLNKGMFTNRAAPTFDAADMGQVVTLGTQIISSGKYSYASEYFNNFIAGNSGGPESIFAYPNSSGVSANNSGVNARWCMTTHYNSNEFKAPNAGWNGFSTIGDFYNSFGGNGSTLVGVTGFATDKSGLYKDTAVDKRIGGRYYAGLTDKIGMKPGFLIGQQYNHDGTKQKDRKNNDLAFDPTIAANMMETGANLEVTGIRVIKYVPDLSGDYWGGNPGNWLQIFRYSDVVLMVAEAKIRSNTDLPGALTLMNGLRAARGASAYAALPPLVPASGVVDDPNSFLAERGRELYWESVRRTDLLRFGMFNKPWQYKPSDDPKYLVFPVPTQALASNPNLKQNPGY